MSSEFRKQLEQIKSLMDSHLMLGEKLRLLDTDGYTSARAEQLRNEIRAKQHDQWKSIMYAISEAWTTVLAGKQRSAAAAESEA